MKESGDLEQLTSNLGSEEVLFQKGKSGRAKDMKSGTLEPSATNIQSLTEELQRLKAKQDNLCRSRSILA